jgi:DNA-binding HxlR family transcriptional regulator
MMAVKRYGQVCPLARGLDIIGERWSLLIVRELMIGPRRYTDLQGGLPGIGTNVLAARLKDLADMGIVTKQTLPPPAPAIVYELTDAGQALGPSLQALRQWGTEHAPPPQPDDAVRPAWVLMSAANTPSRIAAPGKVCQLQIGQEVFHLVSRDAGFSVYGGAAEHPDASVEVDPTSFYALVSGRQTGRHPSRRSITGGDRALGEAFLSTLRGAAKRVRSLRAQT